MMNFEIMRDSKVPVIGGLYRHFKGGMYQCLNIARHEDERDKISVVYRNIEDGQVWIREIGCFMSDRDMDKYPNFEQKKRFEYIGMPKYDFWR